MRKVPESGPLRELYRNHRRKCGAYDVILRTVGELPLVAVFALNGLGGDAADGLFLDQLSGLFCPSDVFLELR